ncbi:MAG TPA: PIN domain-containing protein [Acidimicrobiales bacterium]|jgi:predicted nucleic acid-binding protein|nr:PIN domain-containing protein [Acidimicrobiales bacterium]
MTDAFDSDVLIYVAGDDPLGADVASLFDAVDDEGFVGLGSVLLIPELLPKPSRERDSQQVLRITALLRRLDLRPVDEALAVLSAQLGARYRLRALDAVHLATAVHYGADRFLTNNRRDFPTTITEVDITYPDQLGSDAEAGR